MSMVGGEVGAVAGLAGIAGGLLVVGAVVESSEGLARQAQSTEVRAQPRREDDPWTGHGMSYGLDYGKARRERGDAPAPPTRPRRRMNYGEELASRVSNFGYAYGGGKARV